MVILISNSCLGLAMICEEFVNCISIPDSWGDAFPITAPNWDLILASDILLCKYLPYVLLHNYCMYSVRPSTDLVVDIELFL